MKQLFVPLLALLTLSACEQQPAGEPVIRTELGQPTPSAETPELMPDAEETEQPSAAETTDAICRSAAFEGISLTHCIADPERHTIRTALAPSSGTEFGTIESWAAGRNQSDIGFVINAGAFGDNLKAIGYFVQDSDRLVELNRDEGSGNFFLKPNGVFFGTDGNWRILDSDTFQRTIGTRPKFGTQSGPMLVINGDLHPDITENGPSRAIRSGVGIAADGKAHFVISNEPLSFGQIARYFRDQLKVPNALFLDGNNSSLWDPATGRMDNGRVGPLLIVETK